MNAHKSKQPNPQTETHLRPQELSAPSAAIRIECTKWRDFSAIAIEISGAGAAWLRFFGSKKCLACPTSLAMLPCDWRSQAVAMLFGDFPGKLSEKNISAAVWLFQNCFPQFSLRCPVARIILQASKSTVLIRDVYMSLLVNIGKQNNPQCKRQSLSSLCHDAWGKSLRCQSVIANYGGVLNSPL